MTTAVCVHHWRIESPHGPESEGVCKLCGEKRMFANFTPETRGLWSMTKSRRHEYSD